MKPTYSFHHFALFYRIILSIVSAVFFVYYGSNVDFLDALLIGSFYIAVGGNFIIAFLLISIVHYTNLWIDKSVSWKTDFITRILLVLFWGFIIPGIAAYLLAALYFYLFGIDISDTNYRNLIYPIILEMLFTLNVCYNLYFYFTDSTANALIPFQSQSDDQGGLTEKPNYLQTNNNRADANMPSQTNPNCPLPPLIIFYKRKLLSFDAARSIAYFSRCNNRYRFVTITGETHYIKQNLKEIESMYCGQVFFRINRQVIVNKQMIAGYSINDQGAAYLTFRQEMSTPFTISPESMFVISEEKVPQFREWFES